MEEVLVDLVQVWVEWFLYFGTPPSLVSLALRLGLSILKLVPVGFVLIPGFPLSSSLRTLLSTLFLVKLLARSGLLCLEQC